MKRVSSIDPMPAGTYHLRGLAVRIEEEMDIEMTEAVTYQVRDGIATLRLNRPEKLNAWTPDMEASFAEKVRRGAADPDAKVLVVTGSGRGFCAGADFETLDDAVRDYSAETRGHGHALRFGGLLQVEKPVIAAINGAVVGIGLALALNCDLRFIAEGAKVSTAFSRRGLIAEHGTSWLLPRVVGFQNAFDMLYSGRTMPAAEASQLGFARLLPSEGFLDAVYDIARQYAEFASPRSMAIIKRQIYSAASQTLEEAWAIADDEMRASFSSADFREGFAHAVDKRPAAFTGA